MTKGDGYSDAIIGAKGYQIGINVIGGAFVHYGSELGLSITANDNILGTKNGSDFGISVSTAGDINGDGYSDIILAYKKFITSFESEVAIYKGSLVGLEINPVELP